MVSDTPLSDRCAANVVSKLGADISIGPEENQIHINDRDVAVIRLANDTDQNSATSIVEAVPEYKEYREHLWNDHELVAFALYPTSGYEIKQLLESDDIASITTDRPPVDRDLDGATSTTASFDQVSTEVKTAITDGAIVWVHITADATRNITNSYNELDGYCERYPMGDTDRCYDHQGGGPPEGNTNAMTHGLRAQRTNYYQSLNEQDTQYIEALVDSWLDDAPFGRDHTGKINELYRTAIDQHRALNAVDEFVDEDGDAVGLTTEVTVDYDPDTKEEITAEAEHPANLPYSRLDGDIISKLKKLEVIGDLENEQKEATASLAKKLSGMDT